MDDAFLSPHRGDLTLHIRGYVSLDSVTYNFFNSVLAKMGNHPTAADQAAAPASGCHFAARPQKRPPAKAQAI
jgi:hypothetical protein